MKMVIKYTRDGAAKYISHLDMQRAFARAIRRAGIAAQYSQGFNPHILMSFASPLSVGYATCADYLEVHCADGTDAHETMERLNEALPGDIRVEDAFAAGKDVKKLMSVNHSAAWRITFLVENASDCDKIIDTAAKIVAGETYVTPDRKGRPVDIIPFVLGLESFRCGVRALLKNTNEGALNPAVLANAILGESGVCAAYEICRTECYGTIGGQAQPFSALKEE